MRWRKPAAFTPAAAPQPAHLCGRPLQLPSLPRSSLPSGSIMEPVAGRTPSPSMPPPNLAASARGPETGDPEMEETACREMVRRRAGRIIFCFVFVCAASGTQNINKRVVSSVSCSRGARLTQERAHLVLNCLKTLLGRTVVSLKLFQRLLRHMAAAAAIVPLGLLRMGPLQHWLHGRVPR